MKQFSHTFQVNTGLGVHKTFGGRYPGPQGQCHNGYSRLGEHNTFGGVNQDPWDNVITHEWPLDHVSLAYYNGLYYNRLFRDS